MSRIGILAYGSLIDDPGKELEPLIIDKITCITPFKVEYARKSSKRGGGPTVIPTEDLGRNVTAKILLLDDSVGLGDAKTMLWRRETGKFDSNKEYIEDKNPSINKVQVVTLENFEGIETVLYTKIGKNIAGKVTPDKLANLALQSLKSKAGVNGEDGVSYLLNNNNNGIVTELSQEYTNKILDLTGLDSLEEVINKGNGL